MKKYFELQAGFNTIPYINTRVFLATEENTGKEFFPKMVENNGVLFTLLIKKDQWVAGEYIKEDEVIIAMVDLFYKTLSNDEELMSTIMVWHLFINRYRNLYTDESKTRIFDQLVDQCYKEVAEVTGAKPLIRATISELLSYKVLLNRIKNKKPMSRKINLLEQWKNFGAVFERYSTMSRIKILKSIQS